MVIGHLLEGECQSVHVALRCAREAKIPQVGRQRAARQVEEYGLYRLSLRHIFTGDCALF